MKSATDLKSLLPNLYTSETPTESLAGPSSEALAGPSTDALAGPSTEVALQVVKPGATSADEVLAELAEKHFNMEGAEEQLHDLPQKAQLIYNEICSHIDSVYSVLPPHTREAIKLSIKDNIKEAPKKAVRALDIQKNIAQIVPDMVKKYEKKHHTKLCITRKN